MRFAKEGVVSVWAGHFADEEELVAYVEWVYPDGEEASRSAFAAHAGLGWFDADFQEANFVGTERDDLRAELAEHSYGATFAEAAAADLGRFARLGWNALFLLYDCEYDAVRARPSRASRLYFVGAYVYRK